MTQLLKLNICQPSQQSLSLSRTVVVADVSKVIEILHNITTKIQKNNVNNKMK